MWATRHFVFVIFGFVFVISSCGYEFVTRNTFIADAQSPDRTAQARRFLTSERRSYIKLQSSGSFFSLIYRTKGPAGRGGCAGTALKPG